MNNIKHVLSIAVTITLLLCSTGCSNTKVKYDITKESIIESQDINKAIQGFDLSDYTATIDCSNLEPSDEEIESRLEEELASYMKSEEIKDRAIKNDDTIKAKIICEYNGHILNNYHKELSEIHIGSDDLPQDFYNELIGVVPEEHNTISFTVSIDTADVSFYKDTSSDILQGCESIMADCYIYIDSILGEKKLPEDLDTAVSEHTLYKCTNADQYKQQLTDDLVKEKKSKAFYDILDSMMSQKSVEFKINLDPLIRAQKNSLMAYYNKCASSNSDSLKSLALSLGFNSVSEFESSIDQTSEQLVKEKIMFYYVAELNDWKLSDEQYISKGQEKVRELGFNTITDGVKVMGSDTIRWETLKAAYIDKFLSTYSVGYEYESDDSVTQLSESSQQDETKILVEK